MSRTRTGLRALEIDQMRWSTFPCRWKPHLCKCSMMDFQMPPSTSGKQRASSSFQIGEEPCQDSISLFQVKYPCLWRYDERVSGMDISLLPHRMGSILMRIRLPENIVHFSREMKYCFIFRKLYQIVDRYRLLLSLLCTRIPNSSLSCISAW